MSTQGLCMPDTFISNRFISLVRSRNKSELDYFLIAHPEMTWEEPVASLDPDDREWLADEVFTELERERYGL